MNPRISGGIFSFALGAMVTVLGYLFGIVPLLAFGLSALILGVMVLYLPEPGKVPSNLATSISLPSLINTERLLEELYLEEKGIYIPASSGGLSKVFVPLVPFDLRVHSLSQLGLRNRLFIKVGERSEERGVLLDAPGSEILAELERILDVNMSNTSIEQLQANLSLGFRALGVGRNVSLQRTDDSFNISLDLLTIRDLEMRIRKVIPRLVAQVGGPVESAIAATVANVTQRCAILERTGFDAASGKTTVVVRLTK